MSPLTKVQLIHAIANIEAYIAVGEGPNAIGRVHKLTLAIAEQGVAEIPPEAPLESPACARLSRIIESALDLRGSDPSRDEALNEIAHEAERLKCLLAEFERVRGKRIGEASVSGPRYSVTPHVGSRLDIRG